MKVETIVKLEDDEIKALQILSTVKCNDIECNYTCPLWDSSTYCIVERSREILIRSKEKRTE